MLRIYVVSVKERIKMDFQKLIRDPSKVHAVLHETNDHKLICTKEVKIYVPARFLERGLAYVGIDNHILGIYGIVVDNQYLGVSLVNAMIQIDPTQTNRIKIDDTDYLEFIFEAGSTVMKSTDLLKVDSITYRIFDEILSGGRVPWYLGYEDVGKLFDSAVYHAGANLGQNGEITQMIASIIARSPKNRSESFRRDIKEEQDKQVKRPIFVSLKSVAYTASNTVAKITGSYQKEGIIAAINNPSERIERIESILLK